MRWHKTIRLIYIMHSSKGNAFFLDLNKMLL